ncbi:MAG: hypothetical protein JW976_02650 [Syntrophaceae bacterium]|nr:hypothetical protein [Syntrophaceae bacterium]
MEAKELKFSKKEVKLTNQDIVKLAYTTKEMIEKMKDVKLSTHQCNCYRECFYIMRNLLKIADKEYLDRHAILNDFFRKGRRRLINNNNQLQWDDIYFEDKDDDV